MSAMDELERALRGGNVSEATRVFERMTLKGLPRGRFRYNVGDTIYLRTVWHYVGTIVDVDVEGRWVELYPAVHLMEIVDMKEFYTVPLSRQDRRSYDEDGDLQGERFFISPVPVMVGLPAEWSATKYPLNVPEVSWGKDLRK